jgi:HK97 family phage prohead protease
MPITDFPTEGGMKALVNEAKKSVPQGDIMVSMDKRQMRLSAAFEKKAAGVYTFTGSTDTVDRVGDVVEQNWDLENYKKNPVLLYAHDYSQLPIGRTNPYMDQGKLKFDVEFVPKEIYPFAGTVEAMVELGFLNAVSVGFKPLDMDGTRIKRSELLELSIVPIPANAEALIERKGMGMRPIYRTDLDYAAKMTAARIDEAVSQWFKKADSEEAMDEEPKKKSLEELVPMIDAAIAQAKAGEIEAVVESLNAINTMVALLLQEEAQDEGLGGPQRPEAGAEDPGAGEDAPPKSIDEQVTKSVLAELELIHIEKVLSDPAAVAKVLQGIKTPN